LFGELSKLLLDLSYFLPFYIFLMATFHVVGKPYFTILVVNFGIVQVTKNIFCAMFVFWQGSLHVFKDVSYVEYNIILSFVY